MKRLLLPLLAGLAVAAPASAATVDSGAIIVGKGAAGVTLGMSSAKVKSKLGTPVDTSDYGVLSYQDYRDEGAGIFDVYPGDHKKTRMFIISFPGNGNWTVDEIKVFKPHAIRKLARTYGDRLVKNYDAETGTPSYQITSRFKHRKVLTVFQVDRFGKGKAHVLDVDILFAD